jgi:hypothetical protein
MAKESRPSKRFEKIKQKLEIVGGTNKWSMAKAILDIDITALLNDDWEPYAYYDGVHWFKKKK